MKNDPTKLRCAVRFPLHLPVAVMGNQGADEGFTEDISAAGILMHCGHDYPIGSTIRFSIRMPARALGAERDVQVQCTGRVVRCTPMGNRNAVGAIIDEYRVAH